MDNRLKGLIGTRSSVVDVGCVSGHLLNDLAGQFDQRSGLDASRCRLDEVDGGQAYGWEFREANLNEMFPLEEGAAGAVFDTMWLMWKFLSDGIFLWVEK